MPSKPAVRPENHNPPMPSEKYTAVSLYSGAGGLDKGFIDAGFKVLWAIDSDANAVETYKANLGDHAICGELPGDKPPTNLKPDVVIGGPPCQGFSVAGRMDPDDPRSKHVHCFLDMVERLEPRAFCMENVKALAENPRWAPTRDALLQRARELEYQVELLVLNASHYGVPQARERMFLIGVRGGSPLCPVAYTKASPPSVRVALSELPAFGEPGNDSASPAKVVPATQPVMRPTAHKGSLLFNGSGRPLDLDAPAKTLPASMGGNATPVVDQEELDQGAEPWVIAYHRHLKDGGKPYKQAPARMRRITVEEAAALQTFPIGWQWEGQLGSRYRQVGNAVPPGLAHRVALTLAEALDAARSQDAQRVKAAETVNA